MSRELSGGTFFRFQVGRPGSSASHLQYISRFAAVREGRDAVLLHNLPQAESERTYTQFRDHLIAFAWLRERIERRCGAGRRSFYQAKISFEREIETRTALGMVQEWLRIAFPHAQAAAFLHRDTQKPHVHLWLNARDVNGKKIQLGYRTYRSLDEEWNQLYSRAMGRATDEHLEKKTETLWARRLGRSPPPRRGYTPERAFYHRQELKNAGHDELTKERAGRIESTTALSTATGPERERGTASTESATSRGSEIAHDSIAAAERALRAVDRLRDEATRLATRESEVKQEKSEDRER